MKILVINPGSTSTKLALYEDCNELMTGSMDISSDVLAKYKSIYDQTDMRFDQVMDFLKVNDMEVKDLDVIVSRGGMLPPLHTGAYVVDEDLCYIMRNHPAQLHASNLGALVAKKLSDIGNIPAYIRCSFS